MELVADVRSLYLKPFLLLAASLTLAAQSSNEFEFIGHTISCDNGYVLFVGKGGDLVRTTGAIECSYFPRYKWWKVYAVEAGGHPARIMAIEPQPEEWEYNLPTPTVLIKPTHKSWWRRIF